MKINKGDIFNLWDTNGRRHDVLNAIKIYTNILYDLWRDNIGIKWASYPTSWMQYDFYRNAINESPDVFKKRDKFDKINNYVSPLRRKNDELSREQINVFLSDEQNKHNLDTNIEQRARHHTSNLVKLGFVNNDRTLSNVGNALVSEYIDMDELERVLPLTQQNIILLRQLLKLRIYSEDKKSYYSPIFLSIYLLIKYENISFDDFIKIVQLSGPYSSSAIIDMIFNNDKTIQEIINEISDFKIVTPAEFKVCDKITLEDFKKFIKNRKQNAKVETYYDFYSKLYDFNKEKNENNFELLKNSYLENKQIINKAFFDGRTELNFGVNGCCLLSEFLTLNNENKIINLENIEYNEYFFKKYSISKTNDIVREYGDTTVRMLSSTGLFKFNTPVPQLNFRKVIVSLFADKNFKELSFGTSNESSFTVWEQNFKSNISILEILSFSKEDVKGKIARISSLYSTDETKLKNVIATETNELFKKHIEETFNKEKISEILKLFENRKNDSIIKKEVSPSGDVPTIFEFVVALAWYFISDKKMDLFNSLNLTLNGDFEPISHAAGGTGDVVINYNDKSIMLEATLMNKHAQKKSEWEPVLRHSVNNAKFNEGKECFTFFIADELDFNTINIWRAVASVPLEATNSAGGRVLGVTIMPFTVKEYVQLLEKNKSEDQILDIVRDSFSKVKQTVTEDWRNDVISQLE